MLSEVIYFGCREESVQFLCDHNEEFGGDNAGSIQEVLIVKIHG